MFFLFHERIGIVLRRHKNLLYGTGRGPANQVQPASLIIIRGIINGAVSGLGIGFVPKYTEIRELEETILIDPFPDIKPEELGVG